MTAAPDLTALAQLVAGMPKHEVLALVAKLCDAAAAAATLWSDDELIERFLGQCSPSGSLETRNGYRRELEQLRRWVADHHPGTPLRALTPSMAEHCLGDLRAQVQEGTLMPRSYNRRVAAWSSCWQWASEPARSEASGITRSPWPRRPLLRIHPAPQALSEAQLTAVLGKVQAAALSGDRIAARDYVLLRLGFLIGCRASELRALRWGDVERLADGGLIRIRHGRPGANRSIRVSGATIDLIETLGRGREDAWLFPNRKGTGPITRQGLCDRFRKWGREAGVRLYTTRMRHSHAQAATRRGVDIFTLSANLGNANIASASCWVAAHQTDSSSLRLG